MERTEDKRKGIVHLYDQNMDSFFIDDNTDDEGNMLIPKEGNSKYKRIRTPKDNNMTMTNKPAQRILR
jgi:hypothetical protein